MAKKKTYTADDIEVLEGLEGVRKNVGMYLGSAETQVLRAFREIYENAVDVFVKGMNDYISVVSQDKKLPQTFTVIDRGPGIPIEKNKKTGLSTLTTIFTTLHAGSNFDKKEKGKSASRGTHGVGSSATNACSESFIVWTCRNNQWYTQSFKHGKPITEVEKCKLPSKFVKFGAKKDCGTVVEFIPDYKLLPKTLIKEKELFDFIKQNAELNSGLKVRFIGEKIDETIQNKKGIITLLEDYVESQKGVSLLGKPFVYEDDTIQVALQWSNLEGEHPLSFVNSSRTGQGGTHLQGLYDTIAKEFKAVGGRGIDFTPTDLREGLIAVIHYRCTDDDYSAQDKQKLNSLSAVNNVKEHLTKPLKKWIKSHAKLVREISLRATNIKKAKAEARKITKAASNLKTHNKSVLVANGKLIMSDKKCSPEKRELFIVEGDSAAGSASQVRDASFQEILKLRGKALNVAKTTSIAKDLQNQEIQNLLIALGADAGAIKKGGKVDSFRVGKIILLTDEDLDGEHIKVLLFSILHKYAPEAFKQGIVYLAKLPLFQASNPKTGGKVFGNTLQELYDIGANKSWHISRFKGLGEMDPEELAPFALEQETRTLERVTYFENDKEEKEYLQLVGNDAQYRKKFLGVD